MSRNVWCNKLEHIWALLFGFGGNGGNGDCKEHTSTDEDEEDVEEEEDAGSSRENGGCGAFLLTIGVFIIIDGSMGGGDGGKSSALIF